MSPRRVTVPDPHGRGLGSDSGSEPIPAPAGSFFLRARLAVVTLLSPSGNKRRGQSHPWSPREGGDSRGTRGGGGGGSDPCGMCRDSGSSGSFSPPKNPSSPHGHLPEPAGMVTTGSQRCHQRVTNPRGKNQRPGDPRRKILWDVGIQIPALAARRKKKKIRRGCWDGTTPKKLNIKRGIHGAGRAPKSSQGISSQRAEISGKAKPPRAAGKRGGKRSLEQRSALCIPSFPRGESLSPSPAGIRFLLG